MTRSQIREERREKSNRRKRRKRALILGGSSIIAVVFIAALILTPTLNPTHSGASAVQGINTGGPVPLDPETL